MRNKLNAVLKGMPHMRASGVQYSHVRLISLGSYSLAPEALCS
jgi:hypothetical protein